MTYPLHLDVTDRPVLVVGAGAVGTRRIRGLVAAGARVTVVAPTATDEVALLSQAGSVIWRPRPFDLSDVIGMWLVHAATDDPTVNARVTEEAERRRIWSVRADLGSASAAATPAVLRVDDVAVSVTSGDPGRSAALRDELRDLIQEGLGSRRTRRPSVVGSVILVGGGPGHADLITVRGRRAVLSADVVVHDRLGPRSLLDELGPDVERIDAGKAPGHHRLTQDEINAVLVDRARRGLRVVRLKGGDPFVLGRGSEEMLACAAAGIPVEVIPGVSSAVAGPGAAGIPVTHRGVSAGFVVLSGHEGATDHVFTAAATTGLTCVVLMGMAELRGIARAFVDAGRPATTPAAVIQRAFDDGQTVVTGSLADIADRAESAAIRNPAVAVIGDVVALAASFDLLALADADVRAS